MAYVKNKIDLYKLPNIHTAWLNLINFVKYLPFHVLYMYMLWKIYLKNFYQFQACMVSNFERLKRFIQMEKGKCLENVWNTHRRHFVHNMYICAIRVHTYRLFQGQGSWAKRYGSVTYYRSPCTRFAKFIFSSLFFFISISWGGQCVRMWFYIIFFWKIYHILWKYSHLYDSRHARGSPNLNSERQHLVLPSTAH